MKILLLSFLAQSYLRFVGWTSRIVWVNRRVRDEQEALGTGFLYAFWHGRQLYLMCLHSYSKVRPLISKSSDGELVARVCQAFGLKPVRGSTSRGGMGAVLEITRALSEGAQVAITPDGPRGPLRQAQRGVLYVAQKTGARIVPVAYGAKRRWIFGSWDEFMVPQPFNRIAMAYGEPLTVAPDDDLSVRSRDLEKALNDVMNKADTAAAGRDA